MDFPCSSSFITRGGNRFISLLEQISHHGVERIVARHVQVPRVHHQRIVALGLNVEQLSTLIFLNHVELLCIK